MEKSFAVAALAALAQETRLDVFRLLVQAGAEGLAAGRVAEMLGLPSATLSFHLNQLRHAGLLTCRRESRSLIYAARYETMNALLSYLTENCCQGDASACAIPSCAPCAEPAKEPWPMTDRAYNVLFLCTGNSARSILAEAALTHMGGGRFRGFSAGSFPRGEVHPQALALLRALGMSTEGARSKSWDEFAAPGAPVMDFVFTVCDQAAGEVCPIWPGQPVTAHWGMADPAAVEGSPAVQAQAFRDTLRALETRIGLFLALPLATLDRMAQARAVAAIGRAPAANAASGA